MAATKEKLSCRFPLDSHNAAEFIFSQFYFGFRLFLVSKAAGSEGMSVFPSRPHICFPLKMFLCCKGSRLVLSQFLFMNEAFLELEAFYPFLASIRSGGTCQVLSLQGFCSSG